MDPAAAVRSMTAADWPAVESIYAAGIADGLATFESTTPSWAEFDASRLEAHRLVAVDTGRSVVGWIACGAVSSRAVYAGVVEHSVYVHPEHRGHGVGSVLLGALVASTERAGVWTIQSSLFVENVASRRLHERHGFRVVGSRERIGRSTSGPWRGRWRDTLLIERRSAVVGGPPESLR